MDLGIVPVGLHSSESGMAVQSEGGAPPMPPPPMPPVAPPVSSSPPVPPFPPVPLGGSAEAQERESAGRRTIRDRRQDLVIDSVLPQCEVQAEGQEGASPGLHRLDLEDLAAHGAVVQLALAVLTERRDVGRTEAGVRHGRAGVLAVLGGERLDLAAAPARVEVPAADARDLQAAVDLPADDGGAAFLAGEAALDAAAPV